MSNKEQLASLLQVYKKGELKNENGSLINGLDELFLYAAKQMGLTYPSPEFNAVLAIEEN